MKLKSYIRYFIFVIGLVVSAAASADCRDLDVQDVWSRATPPVVRVGVVYFNLTNAGGCPRTESLLAVRPLP